MIDSKSFEVKENKEGKYLTYKGLPLVRQDNMICYGDMNGKHVLQMTIMSEKEDNGKMIPDKVLVQVTKTDLSLPTHERIVKQDIKTGFYDAFELGLIWLERFNSESN